MLHRILQKDLMKRKSVNFILFLFITLATVFLGSSANNILVISNGVDYFMNYANVPDVNVFTLETKEKSDIDTWLNGQKNLVRQYDYTQLFTLSREDVKLSRGGKTGSYDSKGSELYLGTTDSAYNLVFTPDGKKLTLQNGEMAMPRFTMEKNHLKVGDKVLVSSGTVSKTFNIKAVEKDAAFGNEMVGVIRLLVSKEDYHSFQAAKPGAVLGLYNISTSQVNQLQSAMNRKNFASVVHFISRSLYKMVYAFQMMIAALLIAIGICLILIALLVLRFTLVFTMEEDYREIGVMKATGFRNFAIKKIYLIKYLAIATAGALLGFFISIPVENKMIESVSQNMILGNSSGNLFINVLCALLVILVIMLFCYGCTRRLNKMSAIEAIRSGQDGERFSKRRGFRLHRHRRVSVPIFLGANDVCGHLKQYLVLMFTFCVSFVLITIPLNTLTTMQSKEMVNKFVLDPQSAIYTEMEQGQLFSSTAKVKTDLAKLHQQLKDVGYDAKVSAYPRYYFEYHSADGKQDSGKVLTLKIVNANRNFMTYQSGKAPVLENEIALSQKVLEANGWQIGDTVQANIGGVTKDLLITGSYSDYMQMGESARMSAKLDCGKATVIGCGYCMVDIDTTKSQAEIKRELQKKLPSYNWYTAQDIINVSIGGIQESLNKMLIPMTALLCGVIMLIMLLMERLFIVREKGEIAMMKSIGFKNRSIRLWQVMRMVWVALASMVLAIPLSMLSNQFVLKPLFGAMGADVAIQVDVLKAYCIYPCILFAVIIAATFIATIRVKKIDIRELSCLE